MAKMTLEKLAEMTQNEFAQVRTEMATLATKEAVQAVDGKVQSVYQAMQEGFASLRRETQEGMRAVLAAIETVEYTKLRMRIDALEERVEEIAAGKR